METETTGGIRVKRTPGKPEVTQVTEKPTKGGKSVKPMVSQALIRGHFEDVIDHPVKSVRANLKVQPEFIPARHELGKRFYALIQDRDSPVVVWTKRVAAGAFILFVGSMTTWFGINKYQDHRANQGL